jgi:hypothetical protein
MLNTIIMVAYSRLAANIATLYYIIIISTVYLFVCLFVFVYYLDYDYNGRL